MWSLGSMGNDATHTDGGAMRCYMGLRTLRGSIMHSDFTKKNDIRTPPRKLIVGEPHTGKTLVGTGAELFFVSM